MKKNKYRTVLMFTILYTDRDHSSSAQIDNSNGACDINVSLSKTTDAVRYTG
ncbi:hypothetical protein OH492_19035 [Vibrio chagasii]|nr:hypothetical protein [Vibrio chagasii]